MIPAPPRAQATAATSGSAKSAWSCLTRASTEPAVKPRRSRSPSPRRAAKPSRSSSATPRLSFASSTGPAGAATPTTSPERSALSLRATSGRESGSLGDLLGERTVALVSRRQPSLLRVGVDVAGQEALLERADARLGRLLLLPGHLVRLAGPHQGLDPFHLGVVALAEREQVHAGLRAEHGDLRRPPVLRERLH